VPSHRQWSPLGRALTVAGDNWTLLIAMALAPGRTRLAELRESLAGVSAGVLDRYLQRMVDAGLVTRTRFREMPPRVEVELTDAGRELLPIAGALARWGLRRAWSTPCDGEEIDVEALLLLLPVLLEETAGLPDGLLELVLEQKGQVHHHLLSIENGSAHLLDYADEPPTATARILGDARAWSEAFGPHANPGALKISGQKQLVSELFAALGGAGA
jgi:DNA-binding HxlR family transcriptional regulator